jgi:hypothetical protein
MEQMGVSKDELLALYIARGLEGQLSSGEDFLAGYINYQAAILGIEGFHDYTEAEKQAINAEGRLGEIKADLAKKFKPLLLSLNSLYEPALGKDLFIAENDEILINPELNIEGAQLSWDKLGMSGNYRINEVARLNMEMRDRVIFHRILKSYNKGKNPFVAYGGSHIVTLEPAIGAYLK